MESREIMVSVCCLVYNHEKYLRKCLDGFVMQETNFKYEVLIHDDASTDHSADIIREYEAKYPDIIKPVYQTENQYSKGVKISRTYLYPKAKGKYLAICEGDDYWCDENKLQRQFDALECNPECKMCVHKVQDIDESGKKLNYSHPNFQVQKGVLESRYFIELTEWWAFQTSSYFCLNDKNYFGKNPPDFCILSDVGDTPLMLYFGYIGKVFYFDEIMSCYRHGAKDGWNSRRRTQSTEKRILHLKKQKQMFKEYDAFSDYIYHDFCIHEIVGYDFLIERERQKYRELMKPKYREHLLQLSRKERLYLIFMAYLPRLMAFYNKLKGRK